MDSTEPSPNNITASNLFRLASILDDNGYATIARDTVLAFEAEVEQFPWCFVGLLGGVVWSRCGGTAIVLVNNDDEDDVGGDVGGDAVKGKSGDAKSDIERAISRLRQRPGVARTVVMLGGGKGAWLRGRNRLLGNLDRANKGVYICEGGTCRVVGLDEL